MAASQEHEGERMEGRLVVLTFFPGLILSLFLSLSLCRKVFFLGPTDHRCLNQQEEDIQ